MSSISNVIPNIPPYRVTADDLPDADKKTRQAIEPLLDALNRTLATIGLAFNALTIPDPKSSSFTTDSTGKATLTVSMLITPMEVWLTKLKPRSGSINAVYSMAVVPQSMGATLSFFGLAASTTYDFTVRYF